MVKLRYELPDPNNFLRALIALLKQQGHHAIASLISESKLSFSTTTTYSLYMGGAVWDAYGTTAVFAVPPNQFEDATKHFGEEEKKTVVLACKEIMPEDSGYEITGARLSILLEDIPQKPDTMEDLKNITHELPPEVKDVILPEDIIGKAKDMSEVYLYTYCAENSLRAFIVKVSEKELGVDYLSKLKLNKDMKNKIANRKEQQGKKKWLSARGDSDIFYLDIDDLGNLIQNNWEIFKNYFESTQWITTNISEIADCRNTVAHHGYLQQHEREIIRLNFIKILKQISDTFK